MFKRKNHSKMNSYKNQMIIKYPIQVWILILLLNACGQQTRVEQHSEAAHHESEELIELTTAQVKEVGIKTGSFTYQSMGETIEANGIIELPPNNIASINVPMEGFIENIRFLEGAYVKKDQTLVVLTHPSYVQLQQDYLQALSRFSYLDKELARQKTLSEAKVSAEKTFQKVESEYKSIRAEVNVLKEKLRFLGISANQVQEGNIQSSVYLTSPFSGTVTKLNVHKGQLVSPQQVIMEVINRDHMHVELQVFQRDFPKIREGQKIQFIIPAFEDDSVYEGEVSLVGKSLDLNTKTIRVHGHFEEQDILIPGLYAEAKIIIASKKRRTIPEDAIIRDNGKYYYFIESGQEADHQLFQKVEVVPGISSDGFTEVLKFTDQSDTANIVTGGAFYLKSEMNKGEDGDED
jgi:cobalt-zinc-cadmium efflux system membrane fusion protein